MSTAHLTAQELIVRELHRPVEKSPSAAGLRARPVPVARPVARPTPEVERPPRADFLSFSPHTVGESEIAEVVATLRSPWITTGPRAQQFEQRFAARVGAAGALALNSCTAGLHLALLASGIGPGDEVVTTPLTFAASVNVIEHVGARPVFADVSPDTLTLDPASVARVITPRTRALLVVHFGGHPADMDALMALAVAHRLVVIEDAAHALPATYHGRMIGGFGNPTAFSFYATKNLTTAEGGMLTGGLSMLARARVLSLHGMSRDARRRYEKGGSWRYDVLAPGFKYNMTDIAAALGSVQLERLEALQRRRRAIVAAYTAAFKDFEAFELPAEHADVEHAWHLYVLRLRAGMLRISRDQFIEELTARNIGTSVHFIPVHVHPFYRDRYGFLPDDFPVAYDNFLRAVSLPLSPALDDEDVADVIHAVRDVARRFRR
jgi:dTDP-4-amino-4,6-dideoxygalactose transaminase